MKVVVLCSQKGGVGKSTLSVNLACAAAASPTHKAAVLDMDPQASSVLWATQRKAQFGRTPLDVRRVKRTALAGELAALRQAGYTHVFIDLPPSRKAWLAQVFQAADLILLPLRPSYFDMRSGYDVWSIVEDRPVRWVLNAGFADGETGAGVNEAVQSELNRTMASLKQSITHHPDWVMSASSGLSVFEYAPQSQASAQLQALWLEVNAYPVVAVKHRYG